MIPHDERLRCLREERDKKQSEIAEFVGVTQQQYSKYEKGDSEIPSPTLILLADYFGVTTDYLLGRSNRMDGMVSLTEIICDGKTTERVIADILALSEEGRKSVLEYVFLQVLKEDYFKQKKG